MVGPQDKQKLTATVPQEAKRLDLLDKDFISAVLHIAKDLKKKKNKPTQREKRRMMFQQIMLINM